VEAVARELVGRDIVPKLAGLCALGQQVSNHAVDLVLSRSPDSGSRPSAGHAFDAHGLLQNRNALRSTLQ
jgi:hypothetical protein